MSVLMVKIKQTIAGLLLIRSLNGTWTWSNQYDSSSYIT